MRAVVVGFGNEHFGQAIQITVFRQGRVHKFLRADDAVLFEHYDKHLGIDDRTGVEKLHAKKIAGAERSCTRILQESPGARGF